MRINVVYVSCKGKEKQIVYHAMHSRFSSNHFSKSFKGRHFEENGQKKTTL